MFLIGNICTSIIVWFFFLHFFLNIGTTFFFQFLIGMCLCACLCVLNWEHLHFYYCLVFFFLHFFLNIGTTFFFQFLIGMCLCACLCASSLSRTNLFHYYVCNLYYPINLISLYPNPSYPLSLPFKNKPYCSQRGPSPHFTSEFQLLHTYVCIYILSRCFHGNVTYCHFPFFCTLPVYPLLCMYILAYTRTRKYKTEIIQVQKGACYYP